MTLPVLSDYTSLIPPQNASKPKFMATLAALVQPAIDIQTVASFLAAGAFDLDQAVGVQLDQVGLWIGRERSVTIPLSGVYFSFDTPNLGFDQGNWQGPFDPTSGITLLDDETYRLLLRAKILMNSWDGTTAVALQAINLLFSASPGTIVTLQDNQDMSMTVGVSGVVPSAALISMLQNDEFNIRPVGVSINNLITSINTTALFGFDVESSSIAGFDVGSWSGQPSPVPGPVGGFALQSFTGTTATFTWVAPLTGQGPYTYELQYQVAGSGQVILAPPTGSTTITIAGLTPFQSYSAQVYAVSAGGPGPVSSTINFTTAPGIPGQVTGVQETASTTTSISLSWSAVPGATTYQVMYRPTGVGNFVSAGPPAAALSATVSGLTAATIYDFTVAASNTVGTGQPSAVFVFGTTGSTPGAVTNLVATSVTQNDIAISWLNPITGNGPFAFAVRYATNSTPIVFQAFTGTITPTAQGGSCDITGLSPGVNYLIQVAASNLGGAGPFSPALSVTTPSGPLNQVAGLTQTSLTATSIALSWQAVVNATQYQVQYRLAGSGTWVNGPLIVAPTTSATVTGLNAGSTYQFLVYAIGP